MTNSQNYTDLWAQVSQKLDRNWKLNLEIIRNSNLDKARRKTNKYIWVTSITLAFYAMSVFFFVNFAIEHWNSIALAASGAIIALWSLVVCIASVHELELLSRLDYTAPVVTLQRQLSYIKVLIIKYLRVLVWILPFSFVFITVFFQIIFGVDIVAVADRSWLVWNLIITVALFTPLSWWMYRKLNTKNIDKKWMNKLLKGNGSQLVDAIEYLKEIESFEKEEIEPTLTD